MTHSGGLAQPEARAAGHLLAVLDERDNSTLVRAVCELAAADRYASEPGEVRYDRVLAWVVERIAEIIIEPLEWGPQEPAAYKVGFRTLDGHAVDFAEAPPAVQYVVRAVAAELDDSDSVGAALDDAGHTSTSLRADILLEALALLDRLLDARLRHTTAE
ncbi:hypothetical protein EV641_105254 [Rhodococcus sp. SMB37]|uniref:hypothetical protein n=1 Tax=Rhodococcus sp. SMB37 TaxID=2512213 RepID=UPI0010533219|nr:hypothetical protein [Rhodococcus sp. SMB37]TCN54229.1 hypothetical protein EV641_105254 [Rhodococcus sp. SMB37]